MRAPPACLANRGTSVTIDGRPVYLFAQDTAAGDVNGQGVNDVWYAVAPDGSQVGP